jgi:hypothetical protein
MKMNDAAPKQEPNQQEILHDPARVRLRAHPPEVVQTQHLTFEVPTREFAAEVG